jgi:hypothetical protein
MGYDAIQIQMQKDRQVLNEAHAMAAREEFPDLDHPAFRGRKRGVPYTLSKSEAIAKAYRRLKKIPEFTVCPIQRSLPCSTCADV